jgi:hypothetical protein
VTALTEPVASASPQFQQLSDEEKVKQIMEKILAPPDAEQRNQSITSNDLSSFEVFADWDSILKLTTTEDLEKKTRLASSDHEAHTEKDKVVILQLVQAWFIRAKNFAFDEMSPGYRSNERLYLDKKEEFRANQEGQTDYRYTRNAYSCVYFILLLCGMHREELDLAELVSLDKNGSPVDDPDSEEEVYERLANVGSWAILPAHSSSPSHQTLYDAASDFWKVVQSLADGRMPVNIQEEHVIVVQCLMEAIFCRQKVASEREHREPLLQFIVATSTDEEDVTRNEGTVITSFIASLQYDMRLAFLNRNFGERNKAEYEGQFNADANLLLNSTNNNVAAILSRAIKYITRHANPSLQPRFRVASDSGRDVEILGKTGITPFSVGELEQVINKVLSDVNDAIHAATFQFKGLDDYDPSNLKEQPYNTSNCFSFVDIPENELQPYCSTLTIYIVNGGFTRAKCTLNFSNRRTR